MTIPRKSNKPKQSKCKVCRALFVKRSITHKACSPDCALTIALAERERAERKVTASRKEAIKSRAKWLAEAQAAFNAFIRARDEAANLPCISCGRYHDGSHDAGHYRSVGAMPSLRFNEDNCHRQCVPCNQHKAGNIVEYRLRLIAKIGADRVAWLELDHPAAKYTIDDAKRIKSEYRAKLKSLKAV